MAEVCVGWGQQLCDDLFKGAQSLCVHAREQERKKENMMCFEVRNVKKAMIIPSFHSSLLVASLIRRRSLNMSGRQKPESYFTRQ